MIIMHVVQGQVGYLVSFRHDLLKHLQLPLFWHIFTPHLHSCGTCFSLICYEITFWHLNLRHLLKFLYFHDLGDRQILLPDFAGRGSASRTQNGGYRYPLNVSLYLLYQFKHNIL
ncbi:hypothetical protein O6H91_Y379600 [Diphasiastrum complanatum]|nr:hypothetical protein O6H91_Y379600 [Diphasiastrum complanatum]